MSLDIDGIRHAPAMLESKMRWPVDKPHRPASVPQCPHIHLEVGAPHFGQLLGVVLLMKPPISTIYWCSQFLHLMSFGIAVIF